MGWVEINPAFREKLHQINLVLPEDFLRLPGVILCGHQDRHVLKVDLPAFLKREHRVPWRDRLTNACAGFGFVSKSTREARTLQKLAEAGIPCPAVLAFGEHERQAFLLLGAQLGMTDIRHYLQRHPGQRLMVARALGRQLALMHFAGFEHGDLYTKHILVGPGPRFCFLDWQRARQRKIWSWRYRQRDLSTIDATMLDSLADDQLRLICLRYYLRGMTGATLRSWAAHIRRLSLQLQQKSRIRALRRLPLPAGTQALVWLDGEAMCVTPACRAELGSQIPDWLRFRSTEQSSVESSQVPLGAGRAGNLMQRRVRRLRAWLSWWRRKPAPEVQHAALLFRLERYGVRCTKLLAFGERRRGPWNDSFLLCEAPLIEGHFLELLARSPSPVNRAHLIRHAGTMLRRLHEAGYTLGDQATDLGGIGVRQQDDHQPLVLTRVDGLKRCTQPWPELAMVDFPTLQKHHAVRRTDAMRLVRAYLGNNHSTAAGRTLARKLFARQVTA